VFSPNCFPTPPVVPSEIVDKLSVYTEMFAWSVNINLLMPNVKYSGRNAPLTSKVAFYIFIQQI
jgi:hypothetical protein